MAHSAIKVANEFLRLARGDEPPRALTPMQLMKLVYIAHGWSLALLGRPLVTDDIQAWQYGPVIPDLYAAVKQFGRGAINGELHEGIWTFSGELDAADKALVADVYRKYGHLNGIQLSNLTHMEGTPWAAAYKPNAYNIIINDADIASHYKRLAKERAGR